MEYCNSSLNFSFSASIVSRVAAHKKVAPNCQFVAESAITRITIKQSNRNVGISEEIPGYAYISSQYHTHAENIEFPKP